MKLPLLRLCVATIFIIYATTFTTVSAAQQHPKPRTQSTSKMALALYLHRIGAKMYGAFWCPYCKRQKAMFGPTAFSHIKYIECDPRGTHPRPDLCRRAKINSFPTWEFKGHMYPGMRNLNDLADLSGFHHHSSSHH